MKDLYYDTEEAFQTAFAEWEADNTNKKAWDTMWNCVQTCCFNIIRKKTKFVTSIEECNDSALDITCIIMNRIKNKGLRPAKLSSCCYLPCLNIFNAQKQFEDKIELSNDFIVMEDGTFRIPDKGENLC